MRKITIWFKSRSEPGVKYKCERHRTGNATCFCPGFVYKRKCWHVQRVLQMKMR